MFLLQFYNKQATKVLSQGINISQVSSINIKSNNPHVYRFIMVTFLEAKCQCKATKYKHDICAITSKYCTQYSTYGADISTRPFWLR